MKRLEKAAFMLAARRRARMAALALLKGPMARPSLKSSSPSASHLSMSAFCCRAPLDFECPPLSTMVFTYEKEYSVDRRGPSPDCDHLDELAVRLDVKENAPD